MSLFALVILLDGILRRALNIDSKSGPLKHSNSYPVLDETGSGPADPPAESAESPKSDLADDDDDPMQLDEDYMYDTVSVDQVKPFSERSSTVDIMRHPPPIIFHSHI
jgi:hypothetical protein